MEEPIKHKNSVKPLKTAPSNNYLITIAVLIGFLAVAITYRIVTLGDLAQSRGVLEHYEEIAGGRDYKSLMDDRHILSRITAQSLHGNGRMPTQSEVESSVQELAQAGELAGELDAQRARFVFFIDVIIYCLAGIIAVFLGAILYKRRHSYLH